MKNQFIPTVFSCFFLWVSPNTTFAQRNNYDIKETVKAYQQFLSGTQLVNYFQTSYTSTYVEYDLCSSGYFFKTVDGNVSTGKYQHDKPYASAASHSNNSGTWKVMAEEGTVYLVIVYHDGAIYYYALGWDSQYGKLYMNGTKWPYQKGGARCR